MARQHRKTPIRASVSEAQVTSVPSNGDSFQPPPPYPVTYEAFLDWADEDTHAEWVDGRIVMTSPANLRHQLVDQLLIAVVSTFVEIHQLGLTIMPPFQMKLSRSGREPDLVFIRKDRLEKLRNTFLDGPADLVLEIVSPDSVTRDNVEKPREYQEAAVPEFWRIDPAKKIASFFQLDPDGTYREVVVGQDGIYRSRELPGFWLNVAWLWQDPLPSSARVLSTIDRDAFLRYVQESADRAL